MSRAARRRVAAAALLLLTACGGGKRPPATPEPLRVGWTQEGIASWYGKPYHGRATASGEIYDMRKRTAAHRTLPFGTRVQVKRLDSGRTVEVRITDRGPFVDGRIIDLSRSAAKKLDLVKDGVARVRLKVLKLSS